VASESTENRRFRLPHCRLTPLSREPSRISTLSLYGEKPESLGYIFAAHSMGLSSFKFSWPASKHACFCNVACNGCSRSSKVIDFVTDRKCVCNFPLVINSNLGPISLVSEIFAGFLLRTVTLPYIPPEFLGRFPWTRLPTLGLRGAKTLS